MSCGQREYTNPWPIVVLYSITFCKIKESRHSMTNFLISQFSSTSGPDAFFLTLKKLHFWKIVVTYYTRKLTTSEVSFNRCNKC